MRGCPFRFRTLEEDTFLESVAAAGGRIVRQEHPSAPATYESRYFITDHLGSTRVVVDSLGTIVQQVDYLPYGEKCINSTLISGENDYLYGGKEFQAPVFNIPWYDSQARFQTTDGMFVSLDPQCEKYYSLSPYAYCAGNPVRYVDRDGGVVETALDIVSLGLGVKSFVSNVKAGNTRGAIWDGVGIVADAISVAVPFLPAGAGFAIKAARAADKGVDGVKAADKAVDAAKGMKNANRVQEGIDFGKESLDVSKAAGLSVEGEVRLVPLNGKGNVKGNRSTVDQLIDNGDNTYSIIETKLSPHSKLSKGQKATRLQVEESTGMMEVRSDVFSHKKGDVIYVKDYNIRYKYE